MQRIDSTSSRARVEVDLNAIHSNVVEISRFAGPNVKIMAVVKSEAYGHGLLRVAQEVVAAGADWLGVATVAEGVLLREVNVSNCIALLSAPAAAEAADIARYRITALAGSAAFLDALHTHRHLVGSALNVHLDIDTGMGRSGVLPENAVSLWMHAQALGIDVDGISTHFADAAGTGHTRLQIQAFEQTCSALYAAGAGFTWMHIDNSASFVACQPSVPSVPIVPARGVTCNLIRPGLLIYGITPISSIGQPISLRPALALIARIATIRKLPKSHAISYGVTHRLTRDSLVATVSIGYGDGYPRALSNVGYMLVRGRRAPILGSVCMDQTMIDVTDIANALDGDEAVCIGQQAGETITVEQIVGLIGATEHEITTGLTARLPRVYTRG